MRKSPIDSRGAGRRNEILILSLLYKSGPMSQTQLCSQTGIGSSTASTIIARLRKKNRVIETQGQSDKRGPKPTLLSINPSGGCVISAEINVSHLLIGIYDMTCVQIDRMRVNLDDNHSFEHVVDLLAEKLPDMLDRSSMSPDNVLGIGVTLGGSVSADGQVLLASSLGWKQIPLREALSRRFTYPIHVYSTKVRMLAEISEDSTLATRNILYVNIGNSVGATLYLNGQVMNGASGRFGEIGHTVMDPSGPECGCGHRGCLEAIVSGPALVQRIQKDLAEGATSILREKLNVISDGVLPEEVISLWNEAVKAEDAYAVQLRQYWVETAARAIAAAINAYDPDTLILAGYVALQGQEALIETIQKRMTDEVFDQPLRQIEILTARCREDTLIKGASMAVLQKHLDVI